MIIYILLHINVHIYIYIYYSRDAIVVQSSDLTSPGAASKYSTHLLDQRQDGGRGWARCVW